LTRKKNCSILENDIYGSEKGEKQMAVILEVRDITKSYGNKAAVRGISFEIEEGEIFALIGPNGAGKTTTLRMISTLLTIDSGFAALDGIDVKKEPAKVRQHLTYLPDEAGAYKNMRGVDYLKFMASLCAPSAAEASRAVEYALEVCSSLGDAVGDKIGSYSKGMVRKLLIARAVMTKPRLAILDEPTSGLDILNALEIRKLIKGLAKSEGMSFLISSHNMLEIDFLSDRVGIIDRGVLYALGTSQSLKEKYTAANLEEVFEVATGENKN